ncbi:MAG: hypothetical protein ABW185_16085, partial [Sedimenticola sp.]
ARPRGDGILPGVCNVHRGEGSAPTGRCAAMMKSLHRGELGYLPLTLIAAREQKVIIHTKATFSQGSSVFSVIHNNNQIDR